MKSVVQYTDHATVSVGEKCLGEINQGYVVYVGIESTDAEENIVKMAKKIAKLRVIPDLESKLNLNLSQINGSILLISQFTLCADTHSNRPSFSSAAKPKQAIPLLNKLETELETNYSIPVKTGQFGAHMEVKYTNLGPITVTLET